MANRLESGKDIVGDKPFGLTDQDARFARYDSRKILKRTLNGHIKQKRTEVRNLFESKTNEELLAHARDIHTKIVDLEAKKLPTDGILREILTEEPGLGDYSLLFGRSPWGEKITKFLWEQHYKRDAEGVMWDDFVMARINRALHGEMTKAERVKDSRCHYQIDTTSDRLFFSPVNNLQETDPTVSIGSDLRLHLTLGDISRIAIYEDEERVRFFRAFPSGEIRLTYQVKPIGSTPQIGLDFVRASDGNIIF